MTPIRSSRGSRESTEPSPAGRLAQDPGWCQRVRRRASGGVTTMKRTRRQSSVSSFPALRDTVAAPGPCGRMAHPAVRVKRGPATAVWTSGPPPYVRIRAAASPVCIQRRQRRSTCPADPDSGRSYVVPCIARQERRAKAHASVTVTAGRKGRAGTRRDAPGQRRALATLHARTDPTELEPRSGSSAVWRCARRNGWSRSSPRSVRSIAPCKARGPGGRERPYARPCIALSRAQPRSRSGLTSVTKRVMDSSSYVDGTPAMRWR